MMFRNPRVRAVLGAGTALAVVAGIGIAVATSSSAASSRYVTAAAATGDVTQTYIATGTISRKNTSEVSFAVSGTVKKVNASVGDQVDAGDVLAVLKKGTLQLAVLNAETSVARANASLYAARHPASISSSGGSSGSGSSSFVTIDPKILNEAVSRINLAILAEADACNAIFGAILPTAEPTATPTTSTAATTTTAGSVATQAATPTATPTPTPETSVSPEAAKADDNPVATASASQLAKTLEEGDFTDDQLQACANARAEVIAANTNLQLIVGQLTKPRTVKARTSSKSSSSSVSASAVASAKADLLKAEQALAAAKQDLADAELVAPISGTVGVVDLAPGDSASAGSVTVVGTGSAVVTFELPLSTRQLVKVGQQVTVTPAGSTRTLTGKITAIASLETSGTSGSSPTYTTTVSVADADGLLATGAKASVLIPVKSAANVLRVPVSAVTPTGTGTATVQVVDAATATTASTVEVQTGAVGGGWVQITSGLDAGKLVVLADNTAAIPSNQSNRRFGTTTGSGSSSRASAAATAVPTAGASGAAASAQPTATASR